MPTPEAKFKIKATDKTKGAFRSIKKSFKSLSSSIFSTKTAIAGLAGLAGIGLIVKSSLTAIDAIGKMSKTYGIATEDLAAFQIAAEIGGSSLNTFAKAAKNVAANVYDYVVTGTGEAKDAFEGMGISVEDLKPIMNDNVALMGLVGDRLNEMEDGAIKVALAKDLLGGRAIELLPALAGGAEQFKKYREEAELTGKALSIDAVKGVEDVNDSMTRLGHLYQGFRDQMVSSLAPAIEDGTEAFRGWLLEIVKAEGGIKTFAANSAISVLKGARDMVGGFANVIEWLGKLKDKLEEYGVVEKTVNKETIKYQQYVIRNMNEALRLSDRIYTAEQNALRTDYQAVLAVKAKAVARLYELQETGEGKNISLLEKFNAGMQKSIEVIEARRNAQLQQGEVTPGLEVGNYSSLIDQKRESGQIILEMEMELQEKLRAIRDKKADEYAQIEEKVNNSVLTMRSNVASQTVSLLGALGQKSKAFAVAAIVLEKGMAIQRVLIQSKVAAIAALTPPPIGLGPVFGQPLAAQMISLGYGSAGLIAATGVAQLSNLGGGGAELGASTNPIRTVPTANDSPNQSQDNDRHVYHHVTVDGDMPRDKLEEFAQSLGNYINDGGTDPSNY